MNFEEIFNIIKIKKIDTIVVDFDHTITTYDSKTTIGVFSSILGKKYSDLKEKIDQKVMESNNSVKTKYLWLKKIFLLKKYKANDNLTKALKYFKIRNSFQKLYHYCKEKNIKIIICSSGYRPLIKKILELNNYVNIEIIANENILKVITPINKRKYIHTKSKSLMIIGDEISDSKMSGDRSVKVGICNDLNEYNKFKKYFDYVLVDEIRTLKTRYTSKTKIKIGQYNDKKIFMKLCLDANEKLQKYNLIKNFYKVSKIAIMHNNYIIYDYIKDFENKTINDYLYGKETYIDLNSITSQYSNSLDKTLKIKKEFECESKRYFRDRTNMLNNYINFLDFNVIILDDIRYDIKGILMEILDVIKKNKKMYSYITQGDPTDTNITTTGYFTDFENAGYNTIVSELSIIFVSLFSHGSYYYPKYNIKAYSSNKNILTKYKKHKIQIEYEKKEDVIYIKKINYKVQNKSKKIIDSFIDLYLNNKNYYQYKDDFQFLKYYICMRLLTPINLLEMCEDDQITILTLVVQIYIKISDLNSLKKFMEGTNESI